MKRRRRKSIMERAFPIVVGVMAAVLILSLLAQTCGPAAAS